MLFDLGLQPGWVAIDDGGAIALMLVDDIGEFRALRGLEIGRASCRERV